MTKYILIYCGVMAFLILAVYGINMEKESSYNCMYKMTNYRPDVDIEKIKHACR